MTMIDAGKTGLERVVERAPDNRYGQTRFSPSWSKVDIIWTEEVSIISRSSQICFLGNATHLEFGFGMETVSRKQNLYSLPLLLCILIKHPRATAVVAFLLIRHQTLQLWSEKGRCIVKKEEVLLRKLVQSCKYLDLACPLSAASFLFNFFTSWLNDFFTASRSSFRLLSGWPFSWHS